MARKRPHEDVASPARKSQDRAKKRPKTSRPHKPKPQDSDTISLNAIKKRARAIERLLARESLNIPADKQNELERELAAHKQRIEDARTKDKRSKMIKKYHMVRFFERKKAMRFVKQLERRLADATDPDEVSQLQADLHVAQVDIDYARYFPFLEPYISLYAGVSSGGKEGKEESDQKNTAAQYLRTPRPPMWSIIEKTREEGQAALEKLQNRQPQEGSSSEAAQQQAGEDGNGKAMSTKKKAKGAAQRAHKVSTKPRPRGAGRDIDIANDSESTDSTDGGGSFFEEEDDN